MIRLPEGFAIHKRDRHHLSGTEWEVRVNWWNADKLDWYPAFKMAKQIEYNPEMYNMKVQYAAKIASPGSPWIKFDTVEDLCVAMTARYRMGIK
jgi:hypothetical protein